jgi:hypothetical protein
MKTDASRQPLGHIDIHGCAYCGENHELVEYYAPNPNDDPPETWCLCPSTGKILYLKGLKIMNNDIMGDDSDRLDKDMRQTLWWIAGVGSVAFLSLCILTLAALMFFSKGQGVCLLLVRLHASS